MPLSTTISCLLAAGALAAMPLTAAPAGAQVSSAQPESRSGAQLSDDPRMDWWRDARFGMFIHWGLYAVPAGEWDGTTTHAEWIRTTAQIPLETYDGFVEQFNPVNFDADAWAAMAADAGMKYIVITTKHHDGFALYDSAFSDFDIMATPFKRDIMAELAEATRAHGLEMCWYYSIMDWHHPDYLPRRGWEAADRPEGDADMDRYVMHLFAQVTELLTKYGDIGVMWFDGEWEATWNSSYGEALYKLCRALQPDVIVNNRVDKGRGGMAGISDEGYFGDFGTPEQTIPATGIPGVDWETCMTMNGHWGYNAADKDFKSTTDLLWKLGDIASKGGNFLLNIGPKADGSFPQESIDRLREIGDWMDVNGEAIYGTTASPFDTLPWGRCTAKIGDETSTLYLHVFDWPTSGVLRLDGLGSETLSATLLADPGRAVGVEQHDGKAYFQVGTGAPDPHSSIIKVEIVGRPIVYRAPVVHTQSTILVDPIEITLSTSSPELEARYTLDGSEPDASSTLADGPITIGETCVLTARTFHHGNAVSGTTRVNFERVLPQPATGAQGAHPGLRREVFEGKWDALPDFANLTPVATQQSDTVALPEEYGKEYVAHRYTGQLRIEKAGAYTFALTSDDGSILRINDELLLDNDGLHGSETVTGVVALDAGWHPITIEWFNKTGGAGLSLMMGPVGGELKTIENTALSHD
ncbi:MAG: alpha-L-fucosidase [Planctomycetota bacterium]|nr:alpha-L-fucosidase [Planctomycetota bacterium]